MPPRRTTLKDGSKKTIYGAWSSRPGVMNSLGFTPSIDTTFYTYEHCCGYAGHISVKLARKILNKLKLHLMKKKTHKEIKYTISVDALSHGKPRSTHWDSFREISIN